jgi:hypothetical protein
VQVGERRVTSSQREQQGQRTDLHRGSSSVRM